MAKKLIIGNWKMNPEKGEEAIFLAKKVDKKDAVIAPPFVFLSAVKKKIKNAKLAAQDVFWETEGSYTGEISPLQLKNLGVKYVILGHSERRALGETNEDVRKKIGACIKYLITPIVCVGETVRDESGNYLSFVKTELEEIFSGFPKTILSKIVIAYEPIWAIGKNAEREATPVEAEEMAIFIKKVLADVFDDKAARSLKIIYGGSVNPKNASTFLREKNISGLLVGRDSLDPIKFNEILKTN